jgi:hypothetical protein
MATKLHPSHTRDKRPAPSGAGAIAAPEAVGRRPANPSGQVPGLSQVADGEPGRAGASHMAGSARAAFVRSAGRPSVSVHEIFTLGKR